MHFSLVHDFMKQKAAYFTGLFLQTDKVIMKQNPIMKTLYVVTVFGEPLGEVFIGDSYRNSIQNFGGMVPPVGVDHDDVAGVQHDADLSRAMPPTFRRRF